MNFHYLQNIDTQYLQDGWQNAHDGVLYTMSTDVYRWMFWLHCE